MTVKNPLRWMIWGALAALTLWVAHIANPPKPDPGAQKARAEIEEFWKAQKLVVDQINEAARRYCDYYKLTPGHPLPPNTFFKKDHPTWKNFTKGSSMQILTKFTSEQTGRKATCGTFVSIGDQCPPKGENYCYALILWPASIMGTTHEIYPPDPSAAQKLRAAGKAVEEKIRRTKE